MGEHRCRATVAPTGEPCSRPALLGLPVCRSHGGAAPRAQLIHEAAVAEVETMALFPMASNTELLAYAKHRIYLIAREDNALYILEPTEENRARALESTRLLDYLAERDRRREEDLLDALDVATLDRLITRLSVQVGKPAPTEPRALPAGPTVDGEWAP